MQWVLCELFCLLNEYCVYVYVALLKSIYARLHSIVYNSLAVMCEHFN